MMPTNTNKLKSNIMLRKILTDYLNKKDNSSSASQAENNRRPVRLAYAYTNDGEAQTWEVPLSN